MMTTVALEQVFLCCDDVIKEEDLNRFYVQGRIIWDEVWNEVVDDLADDPEQNVELLTRAYLAKNNVLNRNEYDYYDVLVNNDQNVFTIKCRLKDR